MRDAGAAGLVVVLVILAVTARAAARALLGW